MLTILILLPLAIVALFHALRRVQQTRSLNERLRKAIDGNNIRWG